MDINYYTNSSLVGDFLEWWFYLNNFYTYKVSIQDEKTKPLLMITLEYLIFTTICMKLILKLYA